MKIILLPTLLILGIHSQKVQNVNPAKDAALYIDNTLTFSGFVYDIKTQERDTTIKVSKEVEEIDNKIYTSVQVLPSFPGGMNEFNKYIQDNLVYPVEVFDNNVKGLIIVNFVVEKDGSLSNIKVIRGISKNCDIEAVRLIKDSPKFIPGKQYDKFVRVSYTIPIRFNLLQN